MRHQNAAAARIRSEIAAARTVALSFPKAGRSWVCFFLARYLAERTGHPLDLDLLAEGRELPPIAFLHEHIDVYEDVPARPRLLNARLLKRRRLMVLVRDPRDTLVSYWYQKGVREQRPVPASLRVFADSPVYGIERISQSTSLLLDFYESHPGEKLLVAYEDLVRDQTRGLSTVLCFALDGRPPDESCLRRALEGSMFEAMRDWERRLTRREARVLYRDRFGPRQDGALKNGYFKVRRGEVGAFTTEMSLQLQAHVAGLPHTSALVERLAHL